MLRESILNYVRKVLRGQKGLAIMRYAFYIEIQNISGSEDIA